MKRILSTVLAACLVFGMLPGYVFAAGQSGSAAVRTLPAEEIASVPSVLDDGKETISNAPAAETLVTVIVELQSAPVLESMPASGEKLSAGQAVAEYLCGSSAQSIRQNLRSQQEALCSDIEAIDPDYQLLSGWTTVVNAVSVRVSYSALAQIRKIPGVKRAYVERTFTVPVEENAIGSENAYYGYSYDMTGLEEVWGTGYIGEGMLVAVMDTGLDLSWAYWNDGKDNYIGVKHVHEAFTEDSFRSESAKENLRYTEKSMQAFLKNNTLFANTQANGNDGIYKNSKVPFAYDYAGTLDTDTYEFYGDVNVYPGLGGSQHGTHVAGTVAGYAETDEGQVLFSGVAPDAQLVILKVFSDDGGSATETCIINAVEDAVALGVDVINMSFGADNGFAVDDTAEADAFARVREAGILMMTSAGNADYASSNNNYGGDTLATNPDTAMMSSPAIYDSNMAVASINNTVNTQSVLSWYVDGEKMGEVPFTDSTGVAMKYQFAGKDPVKMVLVGGYGTYSDYYNAGFRNYSGYGDKGVSGVALVKRGELSFADKVQNAGQFMWSYFNPAANAYVSECPVKAVLVYDNDPTATTLITMSTGEYSSVTSAFISGVDGAAIAEALAAGKAVTMTVEKHDLLVPFQQGWEMSEFTSWGAGPGLELKPDITAPGGNIYSSIFDLSYNFNTYGQFTDYTGSYGMMSGTSMAAPHMTGLTALIEQYIRQGLGITDRKEAADLASRLIMSTAVPQKETETAYYSPRVQGAGLVNVAAAVKTPAYITVDGQSVGKLELGDDAEKTGTYPISFRVNNLTNEILIYDAFLYVQRPDSATAVTGDAAMSYTDVLLDTVSLGRIVVGAGQSAPVRSTVRLTAEQKAEIDSLFPNGSYIEGYIVLTPADDSAPTIGLPFLAFYGDWTKAPIFDCALWLDDPEDGESIWNNTSTWATTAVSSMDPGTGMPIMLGQNYFDPIASNYGQTFYHQENFTISPNGDGILDAIDTFELYQLRQARLIVVEVRDQETDELYYHDYAQYVSMSTYNYSYGTAYPWSLSYFTPTNWDGTDLNGSVLPSGTKCTMTITAYGDGDYGDKIYVDEAGRYVTNFDAVDPTDPTTEPTFNGHPMDKTGNVISFPVMVDTVAPKLVNNAVTFYEENGRVYITGTVEDSDGSIASVEIHPYVKRSYQAGYGDPSYYQYGIDSINPFYSNTVYDAGTKTLTFTADVTEYAHTNESYPGEGRYYAYEWTGNVVLSCGDYGINDRSYVIHVDSTGGLVLSQTSALLHVGEEFDLSVNNNTFSDSPIVRTSSNEDAVLVDEYGHVTAVGVGQAVITVENDAASAVCIVAVEEYTTEVTNFDLSIENFDGLKPDGALIVNVTNLQPADVVITENRWEVFEDDEDWAGLLNVEKYSSDGRTGMIYLNYASSETLIPAGTGHLDVTINGVTRTMTFSWEDVYTYSDDDGLVTDTSWQGEQTYYVNCGEAAELIAKYRNSYLHSVSDVRLYTAAGSVNYSYSNPATVPQGLVLDGPEFFFNGGTWSGRLVNLEGYAIPGAIRVFTRYDTGYEYEASYGQSLYGVCYEYDASTGAITVWNCPYGASNELVIRADGVVSAGNPAGELSGEAYEGPDGMYGPFDWEVISGTGSLETAENVVVGDSLKNAAYYTPSEPGTSIIRATTKDGAFSIDIAVVGMPIQAEKITVSEHHITLQPGETYTAEAVLTPEPTLAKDAALVWKSFDESVVTVDENGVITAVGEGHAYVKVSTAVNCTVQSYMIVEVSEPVHVCPSAPFIDVDTSKWYHSGIDFVVEHGYMAGLSGSRFGVNETVTRAQLVTTLYSVAGKPNVAQAQNPFTDVADGKWYTTPVLWAVYNGITSGTSATTFSPSATVTRAQAAAFLFAFAGHPDAPADLLSSYADAEEVPMYAREALNWALNAGVISGTDDSHVSAKQLLTRAQLATILMKYVQLDNN